MSTHHLEFLLQPASIAVTGASNRPRSVGATVMRNLLAGSFAGPIMPVNPNYEAVAGVVTYPDVAHLPTIPDLAVICTPPRLIPGLIGDLGARGSKAAVVLTAGLSDLQDEDEQERTLQDAMLQAAAPYGLRILGPNCVGLLQPALGLNASFAQAPALPGNIAFVSQSGGLTTAVLGWARARGIGFSYVISLGDCADVGFGDVLEFLSRDDNTSAILLYIESIQAARPFLSAARTTSRHKPVLAVKAGRAPEGAAAAASHTGALAGADAVYDAAMRRAGMLRVFTVEDLFNATETLERARPLRGDRLIIVSNGGGAGILATDALRLNNGRLASLSEATLRKLDAHLPSTWSRQNPVDIIGDAPVERYVKTLRILLAEPQADALLFIHVPTAIVPSTEIAEAIAPLLCQADHTVMSCWLGGDVVAPAQQRFQEAGITTYATAGRSGARLSPSGAVPAQPGHVATDDLVRDDCLDARGRASPMRRRSWRPMGCQWWTLRLPTRLPRRPVLPAPWAFRWSSRSSRQTLPIKPTSAGLPWICGRARQCMRRQPPYAPAYGRSSPTPGSKDLASKRWCHASTPLS